MAKNVTSAATTAQTLDLHIERALVQMVEDALDDVDTQPVGLEVHAALERAVSKPPAVVCAATRQEEIIDRTGIYEVVCAVDLRLPLTQSGTGELIMRTIEDALTHDALETSLNTDNIYTVSGGVIFDAELARELEEHDESRVIAFRVWAGLRESANDGLGTGVSGAVLGIGGGNTLGYTTAA
jgi:hypothetical protein